MRKYIIVCLLAALLLSCGGCRGDLYSIYRDVEQLRPMQTLGLDRQEDAVVVSAAGPDPGGGAPLALCQRGDTVEQALVQLHNSFPEAEPYYAHVEYILLGREAAETGILPWLDWLERDPQMRLDTKIFVARGSARELVMEGSGATVGVTERMEGLETELKNLGEGRAFTVRELASALSERGAGLCGLVEGVREEEQVKNSDSLSVLPAGFALFRGDRLAAELGPEQVPGVLLVLGCPEGARLTLESPDAGLVTLLLDSGQTKSRIRDGVLQLEARLFASLVELEQQGEPDIHELNAALAAEAGRWLEELMALQQELDADFLGLCQGQSPRELPCEIRVLADVERSYDLRDGEGLS